MRSRWLTRRVVLLTIAVVIWVPGCLVAGWWQVTVAMSGNDFGYLYSVEWPIFAVLGVVGWWQLVHDDPETVRARRLLRARPRAGTSSNLETGAGGWTVGSVRSSEDASPVPAPAMPGAPSRAPPATSPAPAAPRTPVRVAGTPPDDELAAYNDYLASLAASGSRKTWRDPLGAAGKRSPRNGAAAPAGAGNSAPGGDGSGGER